MTNLADQLERLAKEATPGEWSLSEPDREGYAYIDAPTHGALARVVWHMEDDKYLGRPSVREQANAALIVALRNALPQIISALRGAEWQGIETAPKGAPSFDAGCREPSEWFLAGRPRRKTLLVRRRAWPQDDGWEDQFGNHYAADAFTHWRPLPRKDQP